MALNQPGITEVRVADGEVRFEADDDAVAALTIVLGQARIGVTALVPETASLEELFLDLTEEQDATRDEAVA